MRVNWKRPVTILTIFVIFLFFYGCANAPKPTVSGSLVFVTGDGSAIGFTVNAVNIKTAGVRTGTVKSKRPPNASSFSSDFVPGEIIVKYKPGFDPEVDVKAVVSSSFILARNDRNIARGALTLIRLTENAKALHTQENIKDLTLKEITRLKTYPFVEYAEPNFIYRPLFIPDDPYYGFSGTLFQWHYPLIHLDTLWNDTAGSVDLNDVRVAVIDTGIARSGGNPHDDFRDGILDIFEDEYNFFITYSSDATEYAADYYHGTHVMGTIAAITNNNLYVAGVAGGNKADNKKGVRVIPIRAIDEDIGGYPLDIAKAIRYAAGLPDTENPPKYTTLSTPAKIINMSLGGGSSSTPIADAIKAAYAAGVVIVAAAGNEYNNESIYPAAYPEVISVGAVTIGGEKSAYSNFGGKIDLVAPGGSGIDKRKLDLDFNGDPDDVLSTSFNGTSFIPRYLAGTSMAAPHVAGAAALVIKALINAGTSNPSPETVKQILTSTATPIGPSYYYGAGLLNTYKAVKTAQGTGQATEVIWAFPKTVRLTGNPPSCSFVLRNIGKAGNVQIKKIEVIPAHSTDLSVGFIDSITPDTGTVDSVNGLTITVSAKPGFSLSTTLHYAELKVTDMSDTDLGRVYVMYKYADPVYVVALDYDTGEPLAYVTTSSDKSYQFDFPSLEEGPYVIGASTDRNGDGYLFVDGEAFGYYNMEIYASRNIINKPVYLSNGDKITNMDFPIVDWE